MPAIHQQGRDTLRKALKGDAVAITHVGVATDATAFADNQTTLDPANGGAANYLIKAAAAADADAGAVIQTDFTMTISGDTEFTGKDIKTIGVLKGAARTDSISRTLRTSVIGVQAGDNFTIGVRLRVQDDSP